MGVGRPGLGALHRPTARPWDMRPGPGTHWLMVRGGPAWGTVTNPTARALASWLCALWGRHKGARGGAPFALVWVFWGWALFLARLSVLEACGRGPLPTGCGCGGCGRGDPLPTPQPALLRAGFARCGGGTRAPRGGASSLGVGHLGWGALPRPTARRWGVRPGPATHRLWMRGKWAPGIVTNPTAGALASWLCALWGRHKGARGRGVPCLGVGRPGLGTLPRPTARPWGVRPGPATQRPLVRGTWASGPVTNPTARDFPSWLCALSRRHKGARGGRLFPTCGASGVGRSPTPNSPSLGRAAGSRYPQAVGTGGGVAGTRHQPHSARSCELAFRAFGPARGRPGGAPLAWMWGVRRWALCHVRAARDRYPQAVGAVCGRGGPVFLGSFCPAAVCRVLCALPGFWAPGGRCCLAPALVAWLWPEACISGVPGGPALVRRATSGPVVLVAPVGFPVTVAPSPTPGAVAPGFTGRLRWARVGRPRTGLIVPAAGPRKGRGAGLTPRRTRSGPRDGLVPGGSDHLQSWAACATVVWLVWTRSLTRPVSRTVRLSTGDSAGAPGLFHLDAHTSPFGSEDATPGSRACVPVRALVGRIGRAGLPGAFWCASPFLWPFCPPSLFGPLRAGVARAPGFPPFIFLSSLSPLAPQLSLAFCDSWPWVPLPLASFMCSCAPPPPSLSPPPVIFFCFVFFSSSRAPLVWTVPLFPALGALGLGALWLPAPPPRRLSHSLFVFLLRSCFFLVPATLGALGLCAAWLGFFSSSVCGLACGVCTECWGCTPPPPPGRLLLDFCCVSCLVVWCRGLLWAVLCGSWCFAVFFGAVWCWCRAVWCVAVLCCWFCRWRSPLGATSPFFVGVVRCPVVPCCFVRCFVVCRAVPRCYVVCCAVCCPGARCCLVDGSAALCGVFLHSPPPAAAPCCRCLVPCRGPLCSAVLLCCAACRAVLCCSRRFLLMVLCCFVRTGWCCVLLPVVAACSLLDLVARCRFLLACFVAVAPAWPRGWLPCCVLWSVLVPRSLCCVLCSVVLCSRVVLCSGALLSVLLCWWCWFVSCPCVCGAVLRCALCCSVPVWSVLLLVPRVVVCCRVLCCLPRRSVVWWCCPAAWRGVSCCLAVPCCVLWCRVALWCRAAGLCCVFSYAAGVPLSFKKCFSVFENKDKIILYPTHARSQAGRPFGAH